MSVRLPDDIKNEDPQPQDLITLNTHKKMFYISGGYFVQVHRTSDGRFVVSIVDRPYTGNRIRPHDGVSEWLKNAESACHTVVDRIIEARFLTLMTRKKPRYGTLV